MRVSPTGELLSLKEDLSTLRGETQGTTTETQCFAYDTLDRLSQAWTATDNCAADPSANSGSTVGDGITGAAYWTSWTFTPLGLRKTETDHGLNGAASAATSYSYGTSSGSQPDTLTSTNTTGATSGNASYIFNPDGNATSRTITTGSTTTSQQLNWNDDGTLASVTNDPGTSSTATSSYIYDADGNLLLQKDPSSTTLYLPGEQLALNTKTGAITGTRFYQLPGGGQVVRTGADPTTSGGTPGYVFQLTDQHGTATLTIGPDLTAASATWREYTPYGGPRGPTVTWADNLGFLNKPDDSSTGLTDIGARWYDPATGTFQSLDPLFEATSPQQHNGYSYSADNPITGSDPTGEATLCNGDGTRCVTPPPGNSGGGAGGNGSGAGGNGSGNSLGNYRDQHNQAVATVAAYLRSIYGYNAVKTEYYIPGAHYNGASYGRADVVLIQGNEQTGITAYVWEVKHCCGPAEEAAPEQLDVYIAALKDEHNGWNVVRGFNIPQLVTDDPTNAKKELVVESTNTRWGGPKSSEDINYDGIVAYWTRNQDKRTNDAVNSKQGYAVYPAGTHVVDGALRDALGNAVNALTAKPGQDGTQSPDAPGSLEPATPEQPAQVPAPTSQQVDCEAAHPGHQAPHITPSSGISLDVKITHVVLASCGGLPGGLGGGDDGEDEGGFWDIFDPWF